MQDASVRSHAEGPSAPIWTETLSAPRAFPVPPGPQGHATILTDRVKTRAGTDSGAALSCGRIRLMTHIAGHDRSQTLLLPESLDDYVGPENPVRFIDAFVDGLDLDGGGVCPCRAEGDRPSRLCARRSAEALHLRLPEPGAVQPPAGSRDPPQHRGDLAAAAPEARLQDHRRFPPRQPQRLPPGLPPIRAAVPPAGPVRPGAAGGGWHADQGGQQQGPQFHPRVADRVHQTRRRQARRLSAAPRPERCRRDAQQAARGSRTWPRRSPRSATRRTRCQDMLAELDRPARTRSRSPTPTAGRWRRTRVLPWATTCRSRSIPSTS